MLFRSGSFKNGAVTHLRDYFREDGATPSLRMFNLRHEFPTQWPRFLNPTAPATANVFELEMSPNLFPFRDGEKTLKVNTIVLLARCTQAGSYNVDVTLTPPLPATSVTMTLARIAQYGGLHFSQKDVSTLSDPIQVVPSDPPVTWQLTMTHSSGAHIQSGEVSDLILVLGYEWE